MQLREHGRGATKQLPLALICPQHAQPVEDRRCIHKCTNDGARSKLRTAELIFEPYRKLAHPAVAERGGDGEKLEIEREALHEQQRHDVVHDSATEHFQPDLGVAHVEPEEHPVQLLVAPARDPA